MPRKSEGPRFYPSKNAWFANLDGGRLRLADGPKDAETERQARERYDLETQARKVQKDGDRAECRFVLNAFLRWQATRQEPEPVAPGTLRYNTVFVNSFVAVYGRVPWLDLKPSHFDDWLTRKSVGWGKSTRRSAYKLLRRACDWACGPGDLTTRNPLRLPGSERMKLRGISYQGKRPCIADDEHRSLLAHALGRANKDFAGLLMFWYGTGSRPAEKALANASEWDEERQAFVIQPTPENRGRYKLVYQGKTRTVFVPDYLVPLVRVLAKKYPTGTLFRTESGGDFTNPVVCGRINDSIGYVNAKAGRQVVRPAVSAYSYRHAFVTRHLEAGRDPVKLAQLLGTSLTMLHQHYSHLFERPETLRSALNEGPRTATSGRPG